jgi:hypothetical protein
MIQPSDWDTCRVLRRLEVQTYNHAKHVYLWRTPSARVAWGTTVWGSVTEEDATR